jgi:endonuclease/exonuclease/phosphatase family metal-dependent hydrolase
MRALDRVFYRGALRVQHAFAVHTKAARQASDHLPLVADFEWAS